MDDCHRAE